MKTIHFTTHDDFKIFIQKSKSDWLFRGQVNHYTDDNRDVSITSSFDRLGCIPDKMFEWTHYAKSILRTFGTLEYHEIDVATSQAILQHYGWRSFFIDLTSSIEISCWFASQECSKNYKMDMCENFEEDPVILAPTIASYRATNKAGHIYVIDKEKISEFGLELHDLTNLKVSGGRLRFNTQKAFLVGGKAGKIPPEIVSHHLIVEYEVLEKVCFETNFISVENVFPRRQDDLFLNALLSIPWEKISKNEETHIPIYKRSLELPEYDYKYIKHLGAKTVLYEQFWIADHRPESSEFETIPFFRLPNIAYFANTDESFDCSFVSEILDKNNAFAVEFDGLIMIPELVHKQEFEKGILVKKIENDLVCVLGIMMQHPGHLVEGIGVNFGWLYNQHSGIWNRVEHPDECPCDNKLRHVLEFSVLRFLNESLKEGRILAQDELNYTETSLVLNNRGSGLGHVR